MTVTAEERSLLATEVVPQIVDGKVLYLSNQRPVIAGVEPISQDPNWAPSSVARGFLDPGPSVSQAAVNRVLDVLRPLLGMGCSASGTRFHEWYNREVDNLGAWCWAWCNITVSYATTFGGANNIYKDRAYVPFSTQDAQAGVLGSEWHSGSAGMQPGDLVIFEWGDSDWGNLWGYDHIGICEYDLGGGYWSTLEGNTPTLQRHKRDRRYIVGYIRLDWAKADGVVPTPPAPKPPVVTAPGVSAPAYPLPSGSYFGPRYPLSNDQSVSGYYSHREDLRRWQQRMKDRGWSITVDGLYGPNTADVARRFQTEKGLEVDGLIGPATWRAAWEAPVTA